MRVCAVKGTNSAPGGALAAPASGPRSVAAHDHADVLARLHPLTIADTHDEPITRSA